MDPGRPRDQPLFAGLSKRELVDVGRVTDDVDIREGEHLLDEGRFAHEFMVIERGEAQVLHDGQEIAMLGPGDFIGEIGAEQRRPQRDRHREGAHDGDRDDREGLQEGVERLPVGQVDAAVADRTRSLTLG